MGYVVVVKDDNWEIRFFMYYGVVGFVLSLGVLFVDGLLYLFCELIEGFGVDIISSDENVVLIESIVDIGIFGCFRD